MDKDISDMMQNFSDMMHSSASSNASESKSCNNEHSSFDFSKVSPEMLNQFASAFQKSSENDKTSFDLNTILKMKSVIEKMNQKDDPRSNLLKSLKPYLKESRKEKIDQYITLFSMGKVMELFKETGGDNK